MRIVILLDNVLVELLVELCCFRSVVLVYDIGDIMCCVTMLLVV